MRDKGNGIRVLLADIATMLIFSRLDLGDSFSFWQDAVTMA